MMQIIIYTLMFGDIYHYSKSPYFASFLKSLQSNDRVSFLIFGDHRPPSTLFKPLMRNAKFIKISWHDMVSRIDIKLGTNVAHLYKDMSGKNYKATDFKPLMPMAYPEYFSNDNDSGTRTWIGWTDNDMWISTYLFQDMEGLPHNVNAISLIQSEWKSWGPLTFLDKDLYFNRIVPVLKSNQILQYLTKVFQSWDQGRCFDEWGSQAMLGYGYNYSFSHIMSLSEVDLDTYSFQPNLAMDMTCWKLYNECRLHQGRDFCVQNGPIPENCGYCRLVTTPNETRLLDIDGRRLKFCHFLFSKKVHPKMFTDDNQWVMHMADLTADKSMVSTFSTGINLEGRKRYDGIEFLRIFFEAERWKVVKRKIGCMITKQGPAVWTRVRSDMNRKCSDVVDLFCYNHPTMLSGCGSTVSPRAGWYNRTATSVLCPQSPRVKSFSAKTICSILQGHHVLLVGENVPEEFGYFVSEMKFAERLHVKEAFKENLVKCKNCTISECEPYSYKVLCTQYRKRRPSNPNTSFTISVAGHHADIRKNHSSKYVLKSWAGIQKSIVGIGDVTLMIINTGGHFMESSVSLSDVEENLRYIRQTYPRVSIIWRNTPRKHLHSEMTSTGPLLSLVASDTIPANRSQQWTEFTKQNKLIRTLLTDKFPEVLYLDTVPSTNLDVGSRCDGGQPCFPSHIDSGALQLQYALSVLHSEGRYNQKKISIKKKKTFVS